MFSLNSEYPTVNSDFNFIGSEATWNELSSCDVETDFIIGSTETRSAPNFSGRIEDKLGIRSNQFGILAIYWLLLNCWDLDTVSVVHGYFKNWFIRMKLERTYLKEFMWKNLECWYLKNKYFTSTFHSLKDNINMIIWFNEMKWIVLFLWPRNWNFTGKKKLSAICPISIYFPSPLVNVFCFTCSSDVFTPFSIF